MPRRLCLLQPPPHSGRPFLMACLRPRQLAPVTRGHHADFLDEVSDGLAYQAVFIALGGVVRHFIRVNIHGRSLPVVPYPLAETPVVLAHCGTSGLDRRTNEAAHRLLCMHLEAPRRDLDVHLALPHLNGYGSIPRSNRYDRVLQLSQVIYSTRHINSFANLSMWMQHPKQLSRHPFHPLSKELLLVRSGLLRQMDSYCDDEDVPVFS